MNRIILLIITVCVPFISQAGGGWVYKKGQGFVKISQSAIYADQYFTPSGDLNDITTIGYYATALYAEYGLSDRLTAIAYVPFFSRNTLNKTEFRFSGRELPGDELNSFGDMDVSLKYGIMTEGPFVLSGQILLGLPTGEDQGGETGILQTGDGEFNQMIRVDASRGLGSAGWGSVYAGFNNRTQGFSDEFRWGAEFGWKFWDHFLTILKVDAVASFENGTVAPSQSGTLFSNNMEFISPSLELAWQFEKGLGVGVSAAGALAAQNVLAAPNFIGGVFYKF